MSDRQARVPVGEAQLKRAERKRLEGVKMKQARWWLSVAAATLTVGALGVPSAALAQKAQKKGGAAKGGTTAAASGTVELDDKASAAGSAGADGQPVELDGDAKPAVPEADPAAGGGGICEIDPSACPKATDVKAAADRPLTAEVYAVQQAYVLRRRRLEVNPYWGFTLNDQFVSHPGPGLALNYYITNVLAVGVNGNLYSGLNADSDFNFQNRRAARVSNPINEYSWNANVNFTYVPIYGKFSTFSKFIFHYDIYAVAGVGAISTRPIPVIDPDNRKFDYSPKIAFNAGLGMRIFFTRWLAANLELRDYAYIEKLESLTVDTVDPSNAETWLDRSSFTNHVQAQLGLSVFFPFSWQYKLPK